jgi:hypothetical protein
MEYGRTQIWNMGGPKYGIWEDPNMEYGRTQIWDQAAFGRERRAPRRGERAHLAVADCLEGRHAAQQQQVDFTQRMPMSEYLWHTHVGIREALRADDGGHQRSSERPSALMMEALSAHHQAPSRPPPRGHTGERRRGAAPARPHRPSSRASGARDRRPRGSLIGPRDGAHPAHARGGARYGARHGARYGAHMDLVYRRRVERHPHPKQLLAPRWAPC